MGNRIKVLAICFAVNFFLPFIMFSVINGEITPNIFACSMAVSGIVTGGNYILGELATHEE